MGHVDILHNELLLRVFQFLSQIELCRAVRPTCRRWHDLSFDSSLWRCLSAQNIPNWEIFVKMTSKIAHSIFYLDLSNANDLLNNDDNCLWEVSNEICFVNLRVIDFHETEVDLGFIKMLCMMKEKFPALISLTNLCLNTDVGEIIKTLALRSSWQEIAFSVERKQEPYLCSLDLCDLVNNCPVRVLKLPHSGLENDDLQAIMQTINLEVLDISGCPYINRLSENGIKLATIKELNISDTSISDAEFTAICKLCPLLASVNVVDCGRITDVGIGALTTHCQKLKKLYLNTQSDIHGNFTDGAFLDIASRCSELQELHARSCPGLTPSGIRSLAQGCRRLKVLDLSSCLAVTDEVVMDLAQNCRELQEVILQGCTHLTGQSVSLLITSCAFLNKLYMPTCHYVKDLNLHDKESERNSSIPNSYTVVEQTRTSMRDLILSNDNFEQEDSLSNVPPQYDVILPANMDHSMQLSLIHTCLLQSSCRLTVLDLSFCSKLSNNSVKQIADYCSVLRYLSIRGCYNITNETVIYLAERCRLLQALNIAGNSILQSPKFDDRVVTGIGKLCENLVVLNVSGIVCISIHSVRSLVENCTTLSSMSLTVSPGKLTMCDVVSVLFELRSKCTINGFDSVDVNSESFMHKAAAISKGNYTFVFPALRNSIS